MGSHDEDENDDLYRVVHPGAHTAPGRSILSILHDRSILGRNGIGGVSRSHPISSSKRPRPRRPLNVDADPNDGTTPPNSNPKATTTTPRANMNTYPCPISKEIRNYSEQYSVTKFRSSYLLGGTDDPTSAVSTISVTFSNDGAVLASTHGDHSVKVSCCHSGRMLRCLEGHPRTPWTVKFHPTDSNIVASGCLGYQVRIWNWNYPTRGEGPSVGVCLHMIRLHYAIISLAFHPSGDILAIASGSSLHLWDYEDSNRRGMDVNSGDASRMGSGTQRKQRTGPIEERYEHALRCVHFPPGGDSIIVGGVNPPLESGDGMSFSLRLCDFDLEVALRRKKIGSSPLSKSRTFVPRALLYNDGGFDVSPCGRYLCACAEYWLPVGVQCQMDLSPPHDFSDDNVEDEDENDAHHRLSQNGTSSPCCSSDSSSASSVPPTTPTQPSRTNKSQHHTTRIRSQRSLPDATPGWHPVTPPIPSRQHIPLSPPSPPGRRLVEGGLPNANILQSSGYNISMRYNHRNNASAPFRQGPAIHTSIPPPPPPHISPKMQNTAGPQGRFVPHVVTVSLNTSDPNQLGKLLEAAPLDGARASGVTCVKFSPSAEFCLLGYGVRENSSHGSRNSQEEQCHPVTALYRINGGMTHVSTMMSTDDDVNIARFHPQSGHGFVYGTKQGKVRILSPKPWNYFSR